MNYIQILLSDTNKAYQEYFANKTDYNRRNYIKNLVVLLEADTYRERILLSQKLRDILGEDQIVYAIHPDYIDFKNNGNPKCKTEDIPLDKSLKIIFKAYASLIDEDLKVFNGPGWEAFLELKKLRNRLVHPKTKEDLIISDAEVTNANVAESWYIEKFRKVLTKYWDQLDEKISQEAAKQFKERYLT